MLMAIVLALLPLLLLLLKWFLACEVTRLGELTFDSRMQCRGRDLNRGRQ